MRYLYLIVLIGSVNFAWSQQTKSGTPTETIIKNAQNYLENNDVRAQLFEFAAKNKIHGDFTLDISIYKKGKVLTVYSPLEIDPKQIHSQNILKDEIRKLEFPVKLGKNQSVKFRHTFSFN